MLFHVFMDVRIPIESDPEKISPLSSGPPSDCKKKVAGARTLVMTGEGKLVMESSLSASREGQKTK